MAQDSDEVVRNGGPVTQTPPASPPSAATDALRGQIRETRAEMSETINAIQERLSPDHLLSEATNTVKDATVECATQLTEQARRAADLAADSFKNPGRAVQRIKANPLPVAMVGMAATWLAVRALRRARPRAHTRPTSVGEGPTGRRPRGIGRVRQNTRLLIGVGTGMACWRVWRARHLSPTTDRSSSEASHMMTEPTR
jgi:hypothetical protein